MERLILRWSYLLGLLCAVLALIARGLNVMGMSAALVQTKGNSIGYHSFVDGALLFFVTAIATALYIGAGSQK